MAVINGQEICNGRVSYEMLMKASPPSEKIKHLIRQMVLKKRWSSRTQVKIIRLARTISDLREEREISEEALWEAMSLSRLGEGQRIDQRDLSTIK